MTSFEHLQKENAALRRQLTNVETLLDHAAKQSPPPPVAAGRAGVELVERLKKEENASDTMCRLYGETGQLGIWWHERKQTITDAIAALSAPGVEEPIVQNLRELTVNQSFALGEKCTRIASLEAEVARLKAQKADAETVALGNEETIAQLRALTQPAPAAATGELGATPKTDCREVHWTEMEDLGHPPMTGMIVEADFARQLERELTNERAAHLSTQQTLVKVYGFANRDGQIVDWLKTTTIISDHGTFPKPDMRVIWPMLKQQMDEHPGERIHHLGGDLWGYPAKGEVRHPPVGGSNGK